MSARTRTAIAWSVLGLSGAFTVGGAVVAILYDPRSFDWSGIGFALGVLGAPLFGALIVSRTPNLVGWLLLVVGMAGTLAIVLGSVADAGFAIPGVVWVAWVANWVWPFSLGGLILILQLFPDGHPLTPRWRWLVALTVLAVGCLVLGSAFGPGPLGDYVQFSNPVGLELLRDTLVAGQENVGWALIIPSVLGSAASLVVRYRRSRGERRQQLKWLGYAASLFGVGWVGVVVTYESTGIALVGQILFAVAMTAIPVAVGIAILKCRLYDIDVVINKTMVYGALAAFITGVYVAIVVGVGALIGSGEEPNLVLSIAATAVVALSFQPVRERVQRVANRLVFGERATPYEVMAGFSERVATTVSVEDVLPRMAEVAARGVGAAAASVSVLLGEGDRHAVWPEGADEGGFGRTVPVRDRGEEVGVIAVRKPPGEAFTQADERLLTDLAAQAGLALRNVRLTAELERRVEETSALARELAASRRRILSARDEERRRLERRVNGGPQRRLAALDDRLRAVDDALQDPARATELLEALGAETAETLDGLRELARGIFPPLLADQGLAAALEAQARKLERRIEIAPELVGVHLDPDAEAAAYFCSILLMEEMPTDAALTASLDGHTVSLTVPGDGVSDATLQRVRDRAEALGGSLRVGEAVEARIPSGDQPELAAAQASSSRSGSNSDLGM
ncbi:MAG: GAF domain-containing protein [Actinomycetota bacterium]